MPVVAQGVCDRCGTGPSGDMVMVVYHPEDKQMMLWKVGDDPPFSTTPEYWEDTAADGTKYDPPTPASLGYREAVVCWDCLLPVVMDVMVSGREPLEKNEEEAEK